MIWFTADHHFGHQNIIKYCDRPFTCADDMNEQLIDRWNARVSDRDEIWHLGDFTLAGSQYALNILERLNGFVHFIRGGHDSRWVSSLASEWRRRKMFCHIWTRLEIVEFEKGFPITLCHYPLRSWERSHYGMMHLHGHTHGTIGTAGFSYDRQLPPGQKNGIRIDVGVDCWDYAPVGIDTIMQIWRDTYDGEDENEYGKNVCSL